MRRTILLSIAISISVYSFSQITDTGDKVGIGISIPEYKLDVNGTFRVRNGHEGKIDIGTWGHYFDFTDNTYPKIRFRTWNSSISGQDKADIQLLNESGNTTLRLVSNGESFMLSSLGIGIDNPEYKLDVNGTFRVRTGHQGRIDIGHWGHYFDFTDNTYPKIRLLTWNQASSGQDKAEIQLLKENGDKNIRLTTIGNSYLLGNLGIGTKSPTYNFHIKDTEHSGQTIESGLGFDNFIVFKESTKQTFKIGIDSDKDLFKISRTNFNDYSLVMDYNGNVGIGTNYTGTHKLAVEGSIGAREIKVEASGWSDFVFQKDYDLKPIEEVETYINTNNHLPDIPTAKEVVQNGINLGEMDAKLLQKIEELTLYIIEQNKRIEELENKLDKNGIQ